MSSGDPATARFATPFGQSEAPSPVPADRGSAAGQPLSPRQSLALAAVCGAFGIAAWTLWVWVFSRAPAQDWMVFYTAARAYFDGSLPLIFDGEILTAALNQRFAAWLASPLNLHPWVYPPTFLLLFLPFGLPPPQASLVVFLISGFIALLAASLIYVGRGQPRWIVVFSMVLCPAVPFNVMTGQNAFFTTALLVGGFGLLGRYPVLGGALLGLLSFKPQLWLMVPVALLAARQWLALVSGADGAYSAWLINGRLNGVSVFACVTWLGAPPGVASLAQGIAIVVAAAIVYRAFRRPGPDALQLAVLLAATMLAAPHASTSDAVLLALATSLFLAAPRREALGPAPVMLAAFVWISPLFNPPSLFRPGCLTPVLILLLLAALIAEIGDKEAPLGSVSV